MPRNRGPGSGYEKRVAKRYEKAGYKVRRNFISSTGGEIDFLATRKGERIVGEVKARKKITAQMIEDFAEKAKYYGKKVFIVRDDADIPPSAWEAARKRNVRIKRVKY